MCCFSFSAVAIVMTDDSFNLIESQDLLEKSKPRLPPAPPHSRSLGEIREGRREGGFVRRERTREDREEGGGRRMSEEEMTILLREVSFPSLPLKCQINMNVFHLVSPGKS